MEKLGMMHKLVVEILESELIPTEWHEAILCLSLKRTRQVVEIIGVLPYSQQAVKFCPTYY